MLKTLVKKLEEATLQIVMLEDDKTKLLYELSSMESQDNLSRPRSKKPKLANVQNQAILYNPDPLQLRSVIIVDKIYAVLEEILGKITKTLVAATTHTPVGEFDVDMYKYVFGSDTTIMPKNHKKKIQNP